MSAANYQRAKDQFLCSICLDVFTHPVTTPCGHNFCKSCITEHWDASDRSQCPLCKEVFVSRPDLRVNTLLSEVVAQLGDKAQQEASSSSSSQQQESKPGDVLCDACTGTKLKALKSCLDCLVSYCETHLEPHLTAPRLKRHQLIEPVEDLEDRMCPKHGKALELFCKTDQTCVCMLCPVLDHKTHEFVPLREEYEEKKAELEETEAEIQQMIQKRRLKIQEIKESVELSNKNADREMAEGVRVFSALKESVEKDQAQLIHTIQEKQKSSEKQAQDFIQQLEDEICDLKKRSSEVEQLSRSEDHLQLLHGVQSLNINQPPPTKDWTQVTVRPPSYEGTVVRAAAQLEETLREETKKLLQAELRRIQQYAQDVTLDPDTAHPKLDVSADGKEVHFPFRLNYPPDNPERFDESVSVLGEQSFSSGRFYFEVLVQRNTNWFLGVVRESINCKGTITLSPEEGHWSIWLKDGKWCEANEDPPVRLSLRSQPVKIGVFVDHEEGLVSFYDADSADLIYSFTGCSFAEKLCPFISHWSYDYDEDEYPCYDDEDDSYQAPLTICAVGVKK